MFKTAIVRLIIASAAASPTAAWCTPALPSGPASGQRAEVAALSSLIASMTQRVNALADSIKVARAQIAELKQQKAGRNEALSRARTELQGLDAGDADDKKKMDSLRAQCAKLEGEIVSIDRRIESVSSSADTQLKDLQKLQEELAKLRKQLDALAPPQRTPATPQR